MNNQTALPYNKDEIDKIIRDSFNPKNGYSTQLPIIPKSINSNLNLVGNSADYYKPLSHVNVLEDRIKAMEKRLEDMQILLNTVTEVGLSNANELMKLK